MANIWRCLEELPALAAVLVQWERCYGGDLDVFQREFLQRTERHALAYPCGSGCGGTRRLHRKASGGFTGVCEDGEDTGCEDVPVSDDEAAVWELNVKRLGRAIAQALGCDARGAAMGLPATWQVGEFGGLLTVVFTIQRSAEEFRAVAAELAARHGKGLIVLVPTRRFVDANALALLRGVKAGVFDLESNLTLLPSGLLQARQSGGELFAAHLPERNETVLESESLGVFRLFGELLAMGTQLKASPAQVFDLMVFKKTTKAETAVACKCAPSLITRRVALIEGHFHMPIEKLIAYASDLKERQTTVKRDRYAKKKQGAMSDDPDHDKDDGDNKGNSKEDDDNGAPQEEYRYEARSADD